MRVVISYRARRDLDALPEADAQRMLERLEDYTIGESSDVVKLGNRSGYRLRSGNWRALFDVDGDKLIVRRIGDRKAIYR